MSEKDLTVNAEIKETAASQTENPTNASVETEAAQKNEKQIDGTPPEVDPTKESFEPLKALYSKDLRISKEPPTIQFQNLAAFDTALKRHGIWGLQQKQEKPANAAGAAKSATNIEPATTTRRFLPHQMPIKATIGSPGFKERHNKNLLKWLEKLEGPLKILAEAMKLKRRVHVITRNEHGVRGYVEGDVISFDKHWNILLQNVLEVWTRRKFKFGVNKHCEAGNAMQDCTAALEELGISLPKQKVKSLNRKNVEITRELAQILLRGEQIVLIQLIDVKN